jgi:predicted enzyme related to lactoylglutathione lyase
MPDGTIGYVNVFVSDLERAIAFYGEVLGLKLAHAAREHGYASFEAGPVSLGLAQVGDDAAGLVGRHTGIGLCVSDLEAAHAELRQRGVRFSMPPQRQPWGGFMAILADPDGNLFYLDEVQAVHGSGRS